jgi:hypothetical protein
MSCFCVGENTHSITFTLTNGMTTPWLRSQSGDWPNHQYEIGASSVRSELDESEVTHADMPLSRSRSPDQRCNRHHVAMDSAAIGLRGGRR